MCLECTEKALSESAAESLQERGLSSEAARQATLNQLQEVTEAEILEPPKPGKYNRLGFGWKEERK